MKITIVDDQACPGCGAYWGHPDPKLDFPNRVKVDTHWKCYNPECKVGFYEDGEIIEYVPTPEHQARLDAASEARQKWLALGTWEEQEAAPGIKSYKLVMPADAGPMPRVEDF